jgi:hypothetical protein
MHVKIQFKSVISHVPLKNIITYLQQGDQFFNWIVPFLTEVSRFPDKEKQDAK